MASWWKDEESSEDEDALYSDEEDVKATTVKENKPAPKSKPIIFDSDSDDERGRVVLPEKEKRYQAIEESVKNLRIYMKAEDWNIIHDKWTSLVEVVSKSRKVIDKDGYPPAFIQCVVMLESLIKQNSGKKKTMKPTQASFFQKVEGKVKKYLTSQGESPNFVKLQSAIEEYKKNPTSEEVPEPKTETVEKTETPSEPTKPNDAWFNDDDDEDEEGEKGEDDKDEDEDDDEMWDDDELSTDNEEDEDFLKKDISYWYTFDEVVPSKRETRVRERKAKPQEEQDADKAAKEEKKEKKQQEKTQEKIDWTPEKVDKEIYELLRKRGAKNYVPKEHIATFKTLISNIPDLNKKLTVTFHLINAQLDTNMNATTLMSLTMWKQVYNEIANTLETLLDNNHVTLCETTEEITAITQQAEPDTLKLPHNVSYGHLMFSIQRLNDEYLRSLQNTEAHSQDYLNRLAHEKDILLLLQYAEKYYEKKNRWDSVSAIAFRELEYLYYKRSSEQGGIEEIKLSNDDNIDDDVEADAAPVETTTAEDEKQIEEAAATDERNDEVQIKVLKDVTPYTNLKETVSRLCNLVYRYSEDRYKRKAMLQQIYHLALHDMFFEARDLVLMTHLQEKILKAKIDTQVMFNRSMVQLGLAAFRKGRLEDANNCLQEIVANSKAKELLAQGIKTFNVVEKTNEQERQEKKRQVPFHQHINIDLIECVQLVAAMLLEIPNQAQFSSKRVISKHFRKVLDYHDRQIFTGPPENTRESIIVAAKALQQGNWKRCRDLIVNLEIWKLMPKYEEVIVLVTKLIQEQALKTYLFTYGQYYDSISIPQLASMFDLETKSVHALVSKLIINEDLYASLDQTTSSIIIHGQDPSQLQHLSLTHAERVSILGESSELQDQKAAAKGWQVPTTQQVNVPSTGFDGKTKGYYPRGGRSGIYTPRSERQFSVASRGTNTNTNKKQRTNVGRTLR